MIKKHITKKQIQKQDDIRARLTVYGMNTLNKRQIKALRKWINNIYTEMATLDVKAYTKNPRFTLYK